jgi:hypothetical protein
MRPKAEALGYLFVLERIKSNGKDRSRFLRCGMTIREATASATAKADSLRE